jgi:hypothetical protein
MVWLEPDALSVCVRVPRSVIGAGRRHRSGVTHHKCFTHSLLTVCKQLVLLL